MYLFISIIIMIIVYVATFKHEYTKEEFSKLYPIGIISVVLILLLGNG